MKELCPHCNANLQGEAIPEEMAADFAATHWSRKISIQSREQDQTQKWRCPDCNGEWDTK